MYLFAFPVFYVLIYFFQKFSKSRKWENLTDEEINDIPFISVTLAQYARLVERKLKEKNGE
jgi:hypothetical protein